MDFVCHYEILQIEKTASFDDIKKAYRQRALQLHPDKNQHDPQGATEKFARLQNAYAVLSDVNERAWYDSHRESILSSANRKKQAGLFVGIDALMAFFNPSFYVKFDDSKDGFYATFRSLFSRLAQQEGIEEAVSSFGYADSPYSPVVKEFYSNWESFSSCISFDECDKYNTRHAENRRMKRLMEKENNKLREAERRKFSDCVCELVRFIKKRDKRVAREEERIKQLKREKQEKREKEKREIHQSQFVEQEWTRVNLESLSIGSSSVEEEEEEEEFYCAICDKSFKSEKQLNNHEKSKKHLSALEAFIASELDSESDEINEEIADEIEGEIVDEIFDEIEEEIVDLYEEIADDVEEEYDLEEDIFSLKEEIVSLEGDIAVDEIEENSEILENENDSEEEPLEKEASSSHEKEESFDEDEFSSSVKKKKKQRPKEKEMGEKKKEGKIKEKKGKIEKENEKATVEEKKEKVKKNALQCNVCFCLFSTRNQLFSHIKETNHALKK